MKRAVLEQVVRGLEHTTIEGDRVVLPEGLRVDVIVLGGSEAVPVTGARELRLGDAVLAVSTDKEETYFLEYEHVLALRTKGKATSHRIGRAGFAT